MSEESIVEYWSTVKKIIDKVCEDYDGSWQKRHRVLNTKIILMINLLLVF